MNNTHQHFTSHNDYSLTVSAHDQNIYTFTDKGVNLPADWQLIPPSFKPPFNMAITSPTLVYAHPPVSAAVGYIADTAPAPFLLQVNK